MSIALSNINRAMQARFKLRTTKLFFTYPQCPIKKDDAKLLLENLAMGWKAKISNYVIAEEQHENGDPHLHVYLEMATLVVTSKADFADLKVVEGDEVKNYHGNYQSVRSVNNVIKYCVKKEDYITSFSEEEMRKKCKISKLEASMKELMANCPLTEVIDKNPSLLTMIGKIKQSMTIYKCEKAPQPVKPQVCGKWVFGPPDVGKSHCVRSMWPNAYIKACNKWWDLYEGQEVVIMEEITKDHAWMFPLLLAWCDKWSFNSEIKGNSIPLKFRKFIITSNYTIDEVFESIPEVSKAALKRRFVICALSAGDDGNQWNAAWEKPARYEDSFSQRMWEDYIEENKKN